jgi:glycosyltransferase involved in cell wall biosynthesis
VNILIFNWRDLAHPWAGGAEVFLHQVARRWVQGGHLVAWLCGRHPGQPACEQVEGIEIIRKGGIYSVYPRAALHYVRHLRSQFDVMFDSANGIPFFSPAFSTTPKLALVHHVHSEVFFRELPWHLAHLANFLERTVMPRLYRHTPFVTVSSSSRRALIRIGVPAEHISIAHNGVDRSLYQPGPKSPKPLLLFVGRLRRYKSIDVAIQALPAIIRVVPNLHFSIVGSGPAESALRALTQRLGLGDHVRFHGYVSQADKVRLLQQAHLMLNPSMKEGWGLTVIEANACGTPVVAADVPGLCDSVQHEKTGLLVPYGDSAALAKSVTGLLLNPNRRRRLAQNALAWAARFDWDQTAETCLRLLASCQEGQQNLLCLRRKR